MPPVLLIFRVGNGWRIPFPLFLVLPFNALAWVALTFCQLFVRTGRDARQGIDIGKHALAVFRHLSGLRIHVQSNDGSGASIWFI